MFTKSTRVVVAALVLAATALTFVANASAAPNRGGAWQGGGPLDTCMTDDGYGRFRPCSAGGY